ncbi:helix-turn-helix domain-containing protein [Methyloversatilis universalis]|uniref:helix-turn-helix domain-containing protein n=1 Tax=Methyloversatilis universalis TaxID=378211 RepID=UPI000477A5B9|nr:helix-turn-helix domain-containing protein [Methyloversatilis universalis]
MTVEPARKAPPPAQLCCVVTEDPCQHAESLPHWSQEYLQLTSGEFRGRIVEMSSGAVQLFRESMDQVIDEKSHPRPSSYTFGVPVNVHRGGYWQAHEVGRDSLLTLSPGEELHFRTPQVSDIFVSVIDADSLDGYAQAVLGHEVSTLIARAQMQTLPSAAAMRYRQVLHEVMCCVQSTPDVLLHAASRQAVSESIINASLTALLSISEHPERSRGGHAIHRAIVERARNYILNRRDQPPSVSDLSTHLKMSRRGLHHAFMNVLGISPVTFLRYVRLHGVRKDLLHGGPDMTVSSAACKWGFWHMGMFSSYYKALFGESPSSTLKRPPQVRSQPWSSGHSDWPFPGMPE